MDIVCRNMEPRDLAAVRGLMRQLAALHAQGRPDVYRECDPLDGTLFSYMLSGEDTAAFVAEADGHAAGFAFCTLTRMKDDPRMCDRTVARVEDICVPEELRGQGIGRRLLERCRAWAGENAADSLELTAWSFNESAIGFYKRLGMTERSVTFEMKP